MKILLGIDTGISCATKKKCQISHNGW